VDHISINPLDPDLILYCHEGRFRTSTGGCS